MEFCSKYGYNYGFEGSDTEEIDHTDPKLSIKKKIRQTDTNIISIKVDELIETENVQHQKPIECKKCQSFLTSLSDLKQVKNLNDEKIKLWKCEFCNEDNKINTMDLFLKDDVTYLIEPGIKKTVSNDNKEANNSKEISFDSNYFTLCIDVSGSMGTVLLTDKNPLPTLNIPNTINRLDAVKSACIENLKKLKTQEPNKKVSLVTFGNEVCYYGDCTKLTNQNALVTILNGTRTFSFSLFGTPSSLSNTTINTPKLFTVYTDDFDMLSHDETENEILEKLLLKENLLSSIDDIRKIAMLTNKNVNGIAKSYSDLETKIKKLFASGGTALGPALLYSICLSETNGSQILLLTDGAANIGFGSLNENDEFKLGEKFYDEAAVYSKEKGITINVITVEGTDCKLAILGKLADVTNGNLNIVDPLNLSDELASILNNKIKATNVKIKLIVNHQYIYIRDDDVNKLQTQDKYDENELNKLKKSVLVKELGTAKNDSEVFFEYGIRQVKNEEKNVISELPFQIQIEYAGLDGAKYVRVVTRKQKFTTDRKEAEKNINSSKLIFASTTQKMATQAINNNLFGSCAFSTATFNMANRLNLTQPVNFNNVSSTIFGMNPIQNFGTTSDQNAKDIYKFSKCTSSFMN